MSKNHEKSSLETKKVELSARLKELRDSLLTGLVERDVAVRLALIAALAGEHLILIGPPGTAKSLVARRLHLAFEQSTYFERLLTRFTVPEELFGPLSIKGLEEDRYERLTKSYLPSSSIAFLDEIFKANSAILNSLLTLLNEREYDNGINREKCPLIVVIGASNELPEGEELDALFDRFLLRLHVGPVSKANFPALLKLRGESTPNMEETHRLTTADIVDIQACSQSVTIPDDVNAMLCDLRDWCNAEGIEVSDRRWRKVVKLLQVSALTNERDTVSIWDCWLLQHCLWDKPETREKLYNWYTARVGASEVMDPSRLTRIVVSWEARLQQDQDSRSQGRDEQGRLLFKYDNNTTTIASFGITQVKRNGEPLYLAPPNANIIDRTNNNNGFTINELNKIGIGYEYFQHWSNREAYLRNSANWLMKETELAPFMEQTRQKRAYIEATLKEIKNIQEQVEDYKSRLLKHIKSLEEAIKCHLWVMPNFIEPASQSLEGTRREVDKLLTRIVKLHKDFEMLPKEEIKPISPPRAGGGSERNLQPWVRKK